MGGDWVRALARVVALTLIAVAFWFLGKYHYAQPAVLGPDAPVTEFSAGRADALLARVLGPEIPHPVSSDEDANVRARILKEFAALGVKTTTYKAFTCNAWRGFRFVPCATVIDIVGEVMPGEGKAIVLLAHYDSVPAGPGASDDGAGFASVLETARALRARGGKSLHPVIAVITEGEEAGLLGAQAFLENPALKARVGVVVNADNRGTRGRSLLFQTSPGDSKLIDLYARSLPFYGTSSLYAEIYKFLPNDTDLTMFIRQGFTSFNFAFAENVADYHTPLDLRKNLSPLTLQEEGTNMLGVASALEQTNYADLKGGDDVYLDIFGKWLPRIPKSWAFALSLLTLLLMTGAALRAHLPEARARDWVYALLLPPVLIVLCGASGFALHTLAQALSGQPDPSYAYPIALREGLGFGVVAMAVLAGRMAMPQLAAYSAWIWFSFFGFATATFLPGISPYFLFPSLLAALAALMIVIVPNAPRGRTVWMFVPAAIVALSIWMPMVATGETLMGLKLHALFTITAAFAAMTLIPYADISRMRHGVWLGIFIAAAVGALIATVIAGFQPAYSKTQAQRLSIRYLEDAKAKEAKWALDGDAPLPPSLRAAADFSKTPQAVLPESFAELYAAPAGAKRYAPPGAKILSDEVVAGAHRVTIALQGSPQASGMLLFIPKDAKLREINIHGEHLVPPKGDSGNTLIACVSRDCATETVGLEFGSRKAVTLSLIEDRYGLPPFAAKLVAARPANAIPSQNGDIVALMNTIDIEAK
ncbi:MAG TPA: M20/M25/M40 family metallo-hydrolase [Rhizomicrobium sp.]|nr:M20/M25/M40 family metallo-hydrolase [Rhizomicrobium sp.]